MSPSTPDDVTLGEVYRRLLEFTTITSQSFTDLNRRLESSYVGAQYYAVKNEALEERVKALENDVTVLAENRRRMTYLVLGSLIFPIVSALFMAVLLGSGGVVIK